VSAAPAGFSAAIPVTSTSPTVTLWLQKRIASGTLELDPAQMQLAAAFDALITALKPGMQAAKTSALGWLMARGAKPKAAPPVRGLYIHGGVGRGKTMLMDIFFKRCPDPRKRRAHFHAFMADVHNRINAHRALVAQGRTRDADPIPPVARAIASESRVICFDEFTVTDIADAMVLSRLFKALFDNGCVLVATSNVAPDDLYRNGLNRDLFAPFIDVLKAHVTVIATDGGHDYRQDKLRRARRYVAPLGIEASETIRHIWEDLAREAPDHSEHEETLEVMGHIVKVAHATDVAALFTFDELCRQPLGPRDYLALVARFETLVIANVPVLAETERNEAKRFILLIDAIYDAHRRLFMSADAEPEALYAAASGTEAFEFARTASRLTEMRSDAWPPRPVARLARAAE
jgi:cell division protein ZapE